MKRMDLVVGSVAIVEIKPDSVEPEVIAVEQLTEFKFLPRAGESLRLEKEGPIYVVHDVTYALESFSEMGLTLKEERDYPRIIIQVMGREAYQDMVKKRVAEMTKPMGGSRVV